MNKNSAEILEELPESTLKFFSSKKVLIVEPKKSLRSTFKKVLRDIGVPHESIEFSEGGYNEAMTQVMTLKPELIISPMTIQNSSAIDLYEFHKKTLSNRLDAGFFILSQSNSLSQASLILDHDIDGCISEPFTADGIKKMILMSLDAKIHKSESSIQYEILKERIVLSPQEVSLSEIDALSSFKDLDRSQIDYLKGLTLSFQNQLEQACTYLLTAAAASPKSYRILKLLAETAYKSKNWKLAYETRQNMLQIFPLNPETIPELIKLSVVNEKFDDIFDYLEIFEELEEKSELTERSIAAGLTICGKFLLQRQEIEQGLQALEKAADLGYQNIEVLKSVIPIFLEQKVFSKALALIELYKPYHPKSPGFALLEMQVLSQSRKTLPKALKIALELVATGSREELVYESILRLSVQLDRNPQFIEDLFNDSVKHHPHRRKDFEQIIKKS